MFLLIFEHVIENEILRRHVSFLPSNDPHTYRHLENKLFRNHFEDHPANRHRKLFTWIITVTLKLICIRRTINKTRNRGSKFASQSLLKNGDQSKC